jgi:L-ribulose-5-phosphate 4-epimerase
MLDALRREVCDANCRLAGSGLVTLTWGNTSGLDRARGLMVIKPSGVPYEALRPEQMVVLDLEGKVVEGDLRPSSDTAAHLVLYRHFEHVGGITHTHSRYATAFAQARREIPCLGTTHADQFAGPVPVTRQLTEAEVAEDYEGSIGRVIVERFRGDCPDFRAGTVPIFAAGAAKMGLSPLGDQGPDPSAMPAALVAGHGPFTWGSSAADSVQVAIALEAVARMAVLSWRINAETPELEPYLREKHFLRKHGPAAYYGQERKGEG